MKIIPLFVLLFTSGFVTAQDFDMVLYQKSIDSINRPYRGELDAKDSLLLLKVMHYKQAMHKLQTDFFRDVQDEYNNPENNHIVIWSLTDSLLNKNGNNNLLFNLILDNLDISRPDYTMMGSMYFTNLPINSLIWSHYQLKMLEYLLNSDYLKYHLTEKNTPHIARLLSFCIKNYLEYNGVSCECYGIQNMNSEMVDKLMKYIK